MNEIRTLFERFWICKDTEKELYYKVKRDARISAVCQRTAWMEIDLYG